MPTWRVRLFGQEELSRSGTGSLDLPEIWWPVFSSLLCARSWKLPRGRLAGMLWPEKSEKSARHCLSTALWRIKMRLPVDQTLISFDSSFVGLSLQYSVWIDLIAFERRVKFFLAAPDYLAARHGRDRLRRALSLYRGPFMADSDIEWIAIERERLRTLFLDGMFALASAEVDAAQWVEARDTARAICALEPLREDAQRLLMTAHLNCGSRALALEQYNALTTFLQRELAIAPMAQTQMLAVKIAGQQLFADGRDADQTLAEPVARDGRQAMLHVRDQLNQALATLDQYLDS